jgi:hypothetical protein
MIPNISNIAIFKSTIQIYEKRGIRFLKIKGFSYVFSAS